MNSYDLTFIIDPITETLEEALLDDDINTGVHSGLWFASSTVTTDDFKTGADSVAQLLRDKGIRVHRMELDLVNQAMIAARCGKSRQAVTNWIKSDAGAHRFPRPYTVASGPLWAWSEVNEWLRRTGKSCFDDACTPSPDQVDSFNVAWRAAQWPTYAEPVEYERLETPAAIRLPARL